jgi:hypothetical protein
MTSRPEKAQTAFVRVRARLCTCVRVRAFVCACVCACVCARVCVRVRMQNLISGDFYSFLIFLTHTYMQNLISGDFSRGSRREKISSAHMLPRDSHLSVSIACLV